MISMGSTVSFLYQIKSYGVSAPDHVVILMWMSEVQLPSLKRMAIHLLNLCI